MSFPLYPDGAFGTQTGHVLGVLLGLSFGFVLERAGFGRAKNLADQFYGGDNRVLKVMFTGIATTAASLALLSGIGVLDLDALTIPETFIGPQVVGGLLLGAGFVVAGYCPGTGVVAAATGRLDGLVAYFGVMLGTLIFGYFYTDLQGFYESGSMGRIRLDQLLGVPFAALAAGVVLMAIGAFLGAEKLERFLAERRHTVAPDQGPAIRKLGYVAAIAGVALIFGFGGPKAEASPAPAAIGAVAPLTLAHTLVEAPRTLWIADLRDPTVCGAARVPGATCRPADDTTGAFLADLPATRTLVLVTDPGQALPDAARAWPGHVEVLEGGYPAFAATVLTAPVLPAEATPAQLADWQARSALHGYFTGAATQAPPPAAAVKRPAGAPAKKGGGC